MGPAFSALLALHLVCALTATLAFWVAGLSQKGGPLHRRAGRWFARLIYTAAASGAIMAIVTLAAGRPSGGVVTAAERLNRQTMWLVLYVLLIIVTPVQHGLATVAAGPIPRRMRSLVHELLNGGALAGSLLLMAATLVWQQWIFLVLVPIGVLVGARNLRYARREQATRLEWEREHLTSLITAGITVHTALLIFGTSRTLGLEPRGWLALVPWVLPAVVGLPLIIWLRRSRQI